ncbi:MAG: type IIL restriction-modification enzyme MmeI [Terriglobia bacterium]
MPWGLELYASSEKRKIDLISYLLTRPKSAPTRAIADRPTRFHVENMPGDRYLVIPEVSSERRKYIPIGFVNPDTMASNLVKIFPNVTLYHFGVLSSAMHMAWVRQVCGRLESRYGYSNKLVYNNFPWPEAPTAKQRAAVEAAAQGVLDARNEFPDATLADLYDPLAMPPALTKAHASLDRAVDLCYRAQLFENDLRRIEHLFALYEKLTAPLLPASKKKAAQGAAKPGHRRTFS